MKLPRVRFTVRRMIVAGAVGLAGCWLIGLLLDQTAISERLPCRDNLHHLALALGGYQLSQGAFPPGTQQSGTLPPERRISWVPSILPWTDLNQNLRFLFDTDRPWDSPENVFPRMECLATEDSPSQIIRWPSPPTYTLIMCPSHRNQIKPDMPGPLHYVGIAGLGADAPTLPAGHPRAGVFGYDRQTRAVDIKDGLSNTMTLAETTAGIGPWTAGGPSTVRGLDPAASRTSVGGVSTVGRTGAERWSRLPTAPSGSSACPSIRRCSRPSRRSRAERRCRPGGTGKSSKSGTLRVSKERTLTPAVR